jgi:hypothetical protein
MRRFYILWLLSWLAHDVGSAADSAVTLRFLAERAPANLGEVLLAAGEKQTPPFALSADRLTDPIKAPARTMVLRLRDRPAVLSEIGLPQAGESFIVLLIPNPKGGYLPVVIRADDPAFRAGDIYLFNNAKKPVLGYVGTTRFLLKPGEGKSLRPAGAHQETFYDVGFAVREGTGDTRNRTEPDQGVRTQAGDRVLRTIRWPVVTRSRAYVFFYQHPVKNRIDYRAVDEFVGQSQSAAHP